MTPRRWILIGIASVALVAGVLAGWQALDAWTSWNSIDRIDFDMESARSVLSVPEPRTGHTPTTTNPAIATTPPIEYQTILVIGTDEEIPGVQERAFADAILLYLVPRNGDDLAVVSIPRDTRVVDPCTGDVTKLNRTFAPCDDLVSEPEHVALAVESLVGIPVDHYSLLRQAALVEIVDAVGGVELCVQYALREGGTDLLPAGCSVADGVHVSAWLQSRTTQELVDGEWRFSAELGDRARAGRRPALLFALLSRLKDVRSPTELASLAEQLAGAVVLSDTLGLGDVLAMAWDLRSRPTSSIRTFTVPTEPDPLPDGSYAVRMITPLRELLEKNVK